VTHLGLREFPSCAFAPLVPLPLCPSFPSALYSCVAPANCRVLRNSPKDLQLQTPAPRIAQRSRRLQAQHLQHFSTRTSPTNGTSHRLRSAFSLLCSVPILLSPCCLTPLLFFLLQTLVEWEIWQAIRPWEFLNQAWTKKDKERRAPNIIKMIKHFNFMGSWVATEIVRPDTAKERGRSIARLLQVAEACKEIGNFNGVMEILSGLGNSGIFRLKASWDVRHQPQTTRPDFLTLQFPILSSLPSSSLLFSLLWFGLGAGGATESSGYVSGVEDSDGPGWFISELSGAIKVHQSPDDPILGSVFDGFDFHQRWVAKLSDGDGWAGDETD